MEITSNLTQENPVCINCAEAKIIYKHLVVHTNLSIMKVQIFGQFYIHVSYPCQTKIQYKTMVLFHDREGHVTLVPHVSYVFP